MQKGEGFKQLLLLDSSMLFLISNKSIKSLPFSSKIRYLYIKGQKLANKIRIFSLNSFLKYRIMFFSKQLFIKLIHLIYSMERIILNGEHKPYSHLGVNEGSIGDMPDYAYINPNSLLYGGEI